MAKKIKVLFLKIIAYVSSPSLWVLTLILACVTLLSRFIDPFPWGELFAAGFGAAAAFWLERLWRINERNTRYVSLINTTIAELASNLTLLLGLREQVTLNLNEYSSYTKKISGFNRFSYQIAPPDDLITPKVARIEFIAVLKPNLLVFFSTLNGYTKDIILLVKERNKLVQRIHEMFPDSSADPENKEFKNKLRQINELDNSLEKVISINFVLSEIALEKLAATGRKILPRTHRPNIKNDVEFPSDTSHLFPQNKNEIKAKFSHIIEML